ncbi:pentapeptide repeat-containing protein [Cylindrospermopsis raciborskii]|nr:pentapeptide repeat-containing protein [Cylindrospermopsis raciborskii]UJL34076.1 pentapeptide repeat-containing protein [Cylindrospermopsis raciborskii Cr2010]UJS06220.1 pentapeptide repeat-containing protein [Cylindrospermopsis raciborskii KLL07]
MVTDLRRGAKLRRADLSRAEVGGTSFKNAKLNPEWQFLQLYDTGEA